MKSTGTVRVWSNDDGWGVIDSVDTPGGCFAHMESLWKVERPPLGEHEVRQFSGGDLFLIEAEEVDLTWEPYPAGQDGYVYRPMVLVAMLWLRWLLVPVRRVVSPVQGPWSTWHRNR
jgi:cold shock CspA family protein